MFRQFHNLIAVVAGALLIGIAGCQAPWSAGGDSKQLETSHHRVTPDAIEAPTMKAASAAADEATVAKIMQEAREISAKNPAAGKLLLDELNRSEPKLWPLVVQQFRSEQAYHDQLVAKEAAAKAMQPKQTAPLVSEPPSAEVGRLTDPRGVRSSEAAEQAFAAATPANMPAPLDPVPSQSPLVAQAVPKAFVDDAAAKPLMKLAASEPNAEPVAQANHVAEIATDHPVDVQQALYSTGANPGGKTSANDDWQTHVHLAIDDLNARVADGPRSTAEVHQLVSLRLLNLLAGDTEAALEPIPNVSTEEQDYWSGQIFALATLLDHHRQPDDKRRAAASVVHLDEAVGHLRELGTLSLRNLAFCKNVFGYGAYEPINDPTFRPGQQVTLYLEIENYHSESTAKGYKTLLGASYEVEDDAGERVASGEFPNVEDTCQSRRRDFHIQYGLVLPKTVKAGQYHLKLAMRDRQSDKLGSASIDFDVR
jgi:hypothetical protein